VIEIGLYDDAGSAYRRREVIGGPLPDQVEEAAQFINAEVGSDLVVVGVHRYELRGCRRRWCARRSPTPCRTGHMSLTRARWSWRSGRIR
jgi:hypothetical protein